MFKVQGTMFEPPPLSSPATRGRTKERESNLEPKPMKPNVKDLSKEQFTSYLRERGQPSYRAAQVWQWLYQKRAVSFDEMSNLSGALRRQLAADLSISRPGIARQSESRDGTGKFL